MIVVRRDVRDGGRIPHGYGVAWYEPHLAVAVCLPIPINVLASLLRGAWLWLMRFGAVYDPLREMRVSIQEQARQEADRRRSRDVELARYAEWERFMALVVGTSAEAVVRQRLQHLREAM